MKLVFGLLLALFFISSTASAKTFSDYKEKNTVVEIEAIYKDARIVAWTGHEHEEYSKSQLLKIAEARANLLCQSFGFASGSFGEHVPTALGPNMVKDNNSGYLPTKGGLKRIEDLGDLVKGFVAPFVGLPRFFTAVNCIEAK